VYPTGAFDPVNRIFLVTPTMVSNTWKQITAQLPVMANIQITIRVNYNKTIVGGLAIDDIKLTPGACPVRSNQICDFSYGYCGYEVIRTASGGGSGIGIIANSRVILQNKMKGPKFDHTTKDAGNYFLFTNQMTDANGYYVTQLIINHLPRTLNLGLQGSCLKFWYQIVGSMNFIIYVAPVNRFSYNDPQWVAMYHNHTTWTMGQLTINADYEHKVVFYLVQPKSLSYYIALDDISISDGACEPPISCDFDTDPCSWHDVDNLTLSNWNWGRFTGILI